MARFEADIVERIYEAAVVPELWSDLCERLSERVDAFSTALITVRPEGNVRWVSSRRIRDQMMRYQQSDLPQRTRRPVLGLQLAPGSFLRDIDLMPMADLMEDPLRAELLEPIGLAWEMGIAFFEPSGSTLLFSILNETEKGPFSEAALARMNAIKGDLARAAFLSARLAFQQARTMTETLSMLGLPALVVGETGEVVSMNGLAEALAPRFAAGAFNRLIFADRRAGDLFRTCLDALRLGSAPPVQSLPVGATEDGPPLVLHIVPVRRYAQDIFSTGRVLVMVTPVGLAGPPDAKVIMGLFDLTRVEARVAQELTSGLTIDDISRTLGIARETVRTHLKAVFRKTGMNRQQELVRMLSGLGNLRPE